MSSLSVLSYQSNNTAGRFQSLSFLIILSWNTDSNRKKNLPWNLSHQNALNGDIKWTHFLIPSKMLIDFFSNIYYLAQRRLKLIFWPYYCWKTALMESELFDLQISDGNLLFSKLSYKFLKNSVIWVNGNCSPTWFNLLIY